MIIRRTDQLKPGDVVLADHGLQRVIASVREAIEHGEPVVWDVEYVHPIAIPAPHGSWATANHPWKVLEPSKLDLAVQRANELAEKYPAGGSPRISELLRDFSDLLALFRAAQ